MPRVRTAKKLAQRIDLQYFTRLRGFRRWRLVLCIAVPLLAVGMGARGTRVRQERDLQQRSRGFVARFFRPELQSMSRAGRELQRGRGRQSVSRLP